jgi:hypothetical protein
LLARYQKALLHGSYISETDMHFSSPGGASQAKGRGFSPIEGGLKGGASVL